jgi:hypothetical protein
MEMIYRVLIGFAAGINEMFPAGAQSIVDYVGRSIGREIAKEMKERGVDTDSINEIFQKLEEMGFKLADELGIEEKEGLVTITIRGCNVCPKKVGGYPIRGTSCPVGGIIIGILEEMKNVKFDKTPELSPGEVCKITLKEESS